jgi:very-short-patch-repair endonuclease
MTEAERVLWKALRSDIVIPGSHFRRQVPIGTYVVDFCSLRHRFVIEVDGKIHETETARRYDDERDRYIRSEGFTLLRVTNDDVLRRLPMVLDQLKRALERTTPTPGPSPQGGGERSTAR